MENYIKIIIEKKTQKYTIWYVVLKRRGGKDVSVSFKTR